jgi:hypothetical protein
MRRTPPSVAASRNSFRDEGNDSLRGSQSVTLAPGEIEMHRLADSDLETAPELPLPGPLPLKSRLYRALQANRLLWLVLAICAACIAHRISLGEFHLNFDESLHAMSGFFFLDFFRDLPLSHPVRYAQLYYAHYPALSGLVHWPPGFYLCEALFFRIFGPSAASARLTVLGFSVLGIVYWYRLVESLLGKWPAAFSSLVAFLVPALLLYEKSVMLEVPALAVSMAAIYYWVRYCRQEHARDLYIFALFTAAAALVKYTTFFLFPFCLFTTFAMGKWRLVLRRRTLYAAALIAVLIGYYYYLLFTLHWASQSSFTHLQHSSFWAGLGYYPLVAREQLGWPLLLLSLAGMFSARWWGNNNGHKVMFSWIAACYITFSVLQIKQGRHVLFWIPPFVYFAAGFLLSNHWPKSMRLAGRTAAVLLAGWAIFAGWTFQRPYVQGYQALAQKLASVNDRGVILYDANYPGTFSFYLHVRDPQMHFVVLRKLLYVPRMQEEGGSIGLLHNSDEVLDSLKQYGVHYIIVSEDWKLELPIQQTLREVLTRPEFRLIARIPIQSNDPDERDSVALYENTTMQIPQAQQLNIPMRALPQDIVVPLSDLHAW